MGKTSLCAWDGVCYIQEQFSSQVFWIFSLIILFVIIFIPGRGFLSWYPCCTKNQINSTAFHPGVCGGGEPRAQMTSLGVLGCRGPPCCRYWDTGPHSSGIPLQCPGTSLQRDICFEAPGWFYHARSRSVYTAAVLQRAGVAPEHPSFGTLSQTPSTCSEAKCEQSQWKFCTRSVIRSKRFDNEQTASISKQRHKIL